MSKMILRTYPGEPLGLESTQPTSEFGVMERLVKAMWPEIDKLDTVNKEYLITVEITELPKWFSHQTEAK